MWNPNLFQNFDLHYEDLPSVALEAARESIFHRGFPKNAALGDYAFTSTERGQTLKTNILAFTHPVRRIPEYAGLTVFNAANGYDNATLVSILARSSAPFHLLHRDGEFSFWASSIRNNEPTPIPVEDHISYDQLDSMLARYAEDINPQRIIDVKQGRDIFIHPIFRKMQPLQLSMWATEVTRERLVQHFGQTVNRLRDYKNNYPISISDENITDIAIQLLGATILADTGVLGDDMRRDTEVSLSKLIQRAYQQFSLYFQKDLFDMYSTPAEEAYRLLRQVRYAGFMPDMLRDLYIAAYSEEERKTSGSYDTPLYLTRRIWENIPVEYLPPDQRVFADMTCGWGSFLIAGHERLSNLTDMNEVSLRDYLWGNDKYFFTAKLAGLGLLLSTSEDRWNISSEDLLEGDWLSNLQPNIIVGNPPFEGSRKESLTTEQKRYQRANVFLENAIERLAPGGYLAMIMPRSFTVAEPSPDLRQKLLGHFDVFELWELPTGVFSGVNPRSMVIFAQKKSDDQYLSHNPTRVRTIQRASLKAFQDSGIFTASDLVIDQSNWQSKVYRSRDSTNTHIMEYNLILSERSWHEITSRCINLKDCAEIFLGAIVGNKGLDSEHKAAKRNLEEYDNPKWVPWLPRAQGILKRPFAIDYKKAAEILYPNGLQWPRLSRKNIFESTKVLVISAPDPSWGRRARVAIERRGYYVPDNFWVVTPLPSQESTRITHEVLAAVISWDVSNAWIIEHIRSLKLLEHVIHTIPFPKNLSKEDCDVLTWAVLRIEKAALESREDPEASQTIDTILKSAYQLDDATFERLRTITEWISKPETTLDRQPYLDHTNWNTSGIVDSVDAEHGTISLYIEGFSEFQTVQIVPSMPGWMLRPGAAFLTKIPGEYLDKGTIDRDTISWGKFHPQPYMYMSEDELLDELSQHFIPR